MLFSTPKGYTDLPSRLPTQSSTLYSNNITKFLLSMVPPSSSSSSAATTSSVSSFAIDLEDEVVRGAIVLKDGAMMFPPPKPTPPTPSPSPAGQSASNESKVVGGAKIGKEDVKMVESSSNSKAITPWQKATREVALVSAGMGGMVALGA